MAWTYDRPPQKTLVLSGRRWPEKAYLLPSRLVYTRGEICFTVIVLLQTLEFWLLSARSSLDVVLAFCLSGSLVAGALMLTQPLSRQHHVPLMTDKAPDHITRTGLTIPLDAQGQTWADLMARISHEIRTPLNAVIGFSDLMERELFGPLGNSKYRDYAAHIKDSGDALLRSAEDTLALSSLLATQPDDHRVQSTALSTLVRDAWFAVETQADRRGITLENNNLDKLEVAGNRRALRQALANMMQEAVHRATPSSTVAITATVQGDTVRIDMSAANTERARYPHHPTTAICVARVLLELQNTALWTKDHLGGSGWTASTVLDLTVQSDFFQNG
jgi:signal transduction histidine kinase